MSTESTTAAAAGGAAAGAGGGRRFAFDAKAQMRARAYPIRVAFRPGTRDVSRSHMLGRVHDDDEADAPAALRRVLGDDDLLATGGTDCVVRVFQREGSAGVDGGARRRAMRRQLRAAARGGGDAGSNTSLAAAATPVADDGLDDDDERSDEDQSSDDDLPAADGVGAHGEDGRRDAAGDDGGGRLVLLQALEGHRDVVYGAAFHRSEPVIASFSADATVRIWRSARSK